MSQRRKVLSDNQYLEDLLYKLFDAFLIVDSSDHLDADLRNLVKVRTLKANVLQDLNDSFPHTDTSILGRDKNVQGNMGIKWHENHNNNNLCCTHLLKHKAASTHQDPCRDHVIVVGEDLRP